MHKLLQWMGDRLRGRSDKHGIQWNSINKEGLRSQLLHLHLHETLVSDGRHNSDSFLRRTNSVQTNMKLCSVPTPPCRIGTTYALKTNNKQ
jgi:hypothetical protein